MISEAQIPWRLRRGMRELDVLLTRYHKEQYPDAVESERAAFRTLLDCEDPDIWTWVMGRAEPIDEVAEVIRALRGE